MREKKIIKKEIKAPEVLNNPIEYNKSFSRGIRVDINGAKIIFISGTASVDETGKTYSPNNFSKQVKRTYDNLTVLLKSEGEDWNNVVMTRIYLKDMKYYGEFNKFRNRFYKELKLTPFPASVCVEVKLCRPDLLVEIEAIAISGFSDK